jgi:hypothetical protein
MSVIYLKGSAMSLQSGEKLRGKTNYSKAQILYTLKAPVQSRFGSAVRHAVKRCDEN